MTRVRNVQGKIVETTGGNDVSYAQENIEFNAVKQINFIGEDKGISFNKPKSPPDPGNLVKGWWSIDKDGNKPIKRALPKMVVYFNIETKNIPDGEIVYMTLFDEDNAGNEDDGSGYSKKDKDDKITLINKGTARESLYEKVKGNKVVKAIDLSNLESFINQEDDKLIELYFRCSYKQSNLSFPKSRQDYLRVGTLVVDRYKMPGLNIDGTDIADDMSYGVGVKNPGTIYAGTTALKDYKEEYKKNGFDVQKHKLFSNASNLDSSPHKAIYSREECYSTKYGFISTGLDVRVFDNLSDSTLFWDFEKTACFYFAKGKLEDNLKKMIAKFKRNEGGIHEDKDLTDGIVKSDVTKRYCMDVEKYLNSKIKEYITDLNKLEDKTIYFGSTDKLKQDRSIKSKNFTRPVYNENKTEGLTIALNDIWSTEITLKELKSSNDNTYIGKYEVILWDHFGLDKPDMEKIFNIIPSVGETFVTWFILQHLRGYKPFLTKIKFEKEFKGSL